MLLGIFSDIKKFLHGANRPPYDCTEQRKVTLFLDLLHPAGPGVCTQGTAGSRDQRVTSGRPRNTRCRPHLRWVQQDTSQNKEKLISPEEIAQHLDNKDLFFSDFSLSGRQRFKAAHYKNSEEWCCM